MEITEEMLENLKRISIAAHIPRAQVEHAVWVETRQARGKTLAKACGHPEWENVCVTCGEFEISYLENQCNSCFMIGYFGKQQYKGGEHG